MANQPIQDPKNFSEQVRMITTSDPVHANTVNPLFERLINNDAYLNNGLEDVKNILINQSMSGKNFSDGTGGQDSSYNSVRFKPKRNYNLKSVQVNAGSAGEIGIELYKVSAGNVLTLQANKIVTVKAGANTIELGYTIETGDFDYLLAKNLHSNISLSYLTGKYNFEDDFNIFKGSYQVIGGNELQELLSYNSFFNFVVDMSITTTTEDLQQKVTTHLAEGTTGAHKAKNIALVDAGNKFVSTELEGAMLELFTNVSNGKTLVGTAITDVDDSLVVPTEPSFSDLDTLIRSISTGKKWASGSVTAKTSLGLTVNGISFRPSLVLISYPTPDANVKLNFRVIVDINNPNRVFKINYFNSTIKEYNFTNILIGGANNFIDGTTEQVNPIKDDGFTEPINSTLTNKIYNWLAIE